MKLDAKQQKAIKKALKILEDSAKSYGLYEIDSTSKAKDICRLRLASYEVEVFLCLFLDCQHKVIVIEEVSHGTVDSAAVYPREVVKKALEHNAAAVIFAHNHPSGNASPSDADINITRRLISCLELFDIRTLDHVIVGHDKTYSFAENGRL